jgi:hypothetical protein
VTEVIIDRITDDSHLPLWNSTRIHQTVILDRYTSFRWFNWQRKTGLSDIPSTPLPAGLIYAENQKVQTGLFSVARFKEPRGCGGRRCVLRLL